MRLIDADNETKWANENLPDTHAGVITQFLRDCGTIAPETLPIVQELREQVCILKTENESLRSAGNSLKFHLEKVTAERDAAIKDMKHSDNCDVCISKVPSNCDLECLECKLDCRCKTRRNESNWQWRGIREGRSGGMD